MYEVPNPSPHSHPPPPPPPPYRDTLHISHFTSKYVIIRMSVLVFKTMKLPGKKLRSNLFYRTNSVKLLLTFLEVVHYNFIL